MMSMLRREVLIPLLLAVAGGAYVIQPWAPAPSQPSQSVAPAARAAAQSPVADVNLEALSATAADPGEAPRNPFRFQTRAVAAAPQQIRRAPTPVPQAPPVPQGPPPPPPITLRFIGLIEAPKTGRVALLSDGRGGLMSGREGDTVEGRYRMLRVGTESIEMAYIDGRGRQTIRLSGQ